MATSRELPVIGDKPHFYGYITGVGVERCPNATDDVPRRLYATFEYNGETSVWLVPNHELFAELARHLIDMAVMRDEHADYGYAKLWISRKNGKWIVDLP
jgi:hypothetical protein